MVKIQHHAYVDVLYNRDTIYALKYSQCCVEVIRKSAGEWKITNINEPHLSVDIRATMVVTPSCVYICNNSSRVYQYSLNGELLQRLAVFAEPNTFNYGETYICAVDVDGKLTCILGDNR